MLDLPKLVVQLGALERRTGRGTGRDVIDHPAGAGQHDDLANAALGALLLAAEAGASGVGSGPDVPSWGSITADLCQANTWNDGTAVGPTGALDLDVVGSALAENSSEAVRP